MDILNIHRWLNIIPDGPDDGSVEPKCYIVDFSINLSFHLDYLISFTLITLKMNKYLIFVFSNQTLRGSTNLNNN